MGFLFLFCFVCVVYLYTEHLCKCILQDDGLAGPKYVGVNRGSIYTYMVFICSYCLSGD